MAQDSTSLTAESTTASADSGSGEIEELEEEYQTQKVLSEGDEIEATITAVGYEIVDLHESLSSVGEKEQNYQVYFDLAVPGGADYTVRPQRRFNPSGGDLIDVYRETDEDVRRDLTNLEGKTVRVSEADGELSILVAGESVPALVEDVDVGTLPTELPADVATSLQQAQQYRVGEGDVCRAIVEDLSVDRDADELTLHLDNSWSSITVPIEMDHVDGSSSDYERLVEKVGQGSVEQIEGADIYIAHLSTFDFPDDTVDKEELNSEIEDRTLDEGAALWMSHDTHQEYLDSRYPEFVMLDRDRQGKWAVFASEVETDITSTVMAVVGLGVLVTVVSVLLESELLFSAGAIITVIGLLAHSDHHRIAPHIYRMQNK